MSYPIPDHTPQLIGPGARALMGAAAAREADAAWLRARLSLHAARITRFLMWMDEAGIPRDQFTAEWFEAIAPTLPQCQIAPQRESKRERDWTWLLADVLYLERLGVRGPSRFTCLRAMPSFLERWQWQDARTLESRLSEARNKSVVGRMSKEIEKRLGADARADFEAALIKACSAKRLQSAVTDF